jgi:hypothetical protein
MKHYQKYAGFFGSFFLGRKAIPKILSAIVKPFSMVWRPLVGLPKKNHSLFTIYGRKYIIEAKVLKKSHT